MSKARDFAALAGYSARLDKLGGSSGSLSDRNLVINGEMTVSQRGTSETGVTTSGYKKAPDRYYISDNVDATYSVSQSTDAPDGFKKSYKIEVTTADTSLAAGQYWAFEQKVEGNNCIGLNKGTSAALKSVVSFWIKSSKTGTYILEMFDADNSRHTSRSYTVDAANTWEKKELVFDADTASGGSLSHDGNESMRLAWWLAGGTTYNSGTLGDLQTSWGGITNANRAAGSLNFADSTNTLYITGIQWELGEKATDFEHKTYDQDLRLCQRYFEKGTGHMMYKSSDDTSGWYQYKATKRTNPTLTFTAPGGTTSQRGYYYSTAAADRGETTLNEINGPHYWSNSQWTDFTDGWRAGNYGFTPASENDAVITTSFTADAEI